VIGLVGTVPDPDFPLVKGKQILVNRGTPALLAATIKNAEVLEQGAPFGYLVGDVGLGHGSRRLYKYLSGHGGCQGGYYCRQSESTGRILCKANTCNPGNGTYPAYSQSTVGNSPKRIGYV